jgi:hypothetical protein
MFQSPLRLHPPSLLKGLLRKVNCLLTFLVILAAAQKFEVASMVGVDIDGCE